MRLVAVAGILVLPSVHVHLAEVLVKWVLAVGVNVTIVWCTVWAVSEHPREVTITVKSHRDHPAHGARLLNVVPGVADLIVLNDVLLSHLRVDIRAGQIILSARHRMLGDASQLSGIELILGSIQTNILGDVPLLELLLGGGTGADLRQGRER